MNNLNSATFRDSGMGEGGEGVLVCPAHKTGSDPAPALKL